MNTRQAVRVVLLSESRGVLLNRVLNPDTGPVWLTPGGGVKAGEDPLMALRRELLEETGIQGVEFFGPVWSCATQFRFQGKAYTQHELFYVAYADEFDLDEDGNPDQGEREISAEFRWWPVSEILTSSELFSPADLGQRLVQLSRLPAPPSPTPRSR